MYPVALATHQIGRLGACRVEFPQEGGLGVVRNEEWLFGRADETRNRAPGLNCPLELLLLLGYTRPQADPDPAIRDRPRLSRARSCPSEIVRRLGRREVLKVWGAVGNGDGQRGGERTRTKEWVVEDGLKGRALP